MTLRTHAKIFSQLQEIFGEPNVRWDHDALQKYGTDATQYYTPNPLAIVFPQSELEVVNLVRFANDHALKLVPSGGRTGYSGGAVAIEHEIVVSFEKMNSMLELNSHDRTIRCQPGVITKDLQDFVMQRNLFFPVDFASSGSSQIGGNIATNAGGIRVVRYGLTRQWVIGLRVVTGKGEILNLNCGLIKNATGYDLMQLFIGSEGTLGFITEATLKLTEPPIASKVVLMSVLDKRYFMDILNELRALQSINAFEFFSKRAVEYVLKEAALTPPFERFGKR